MKFKTVYFPLMSLAHDSWFCFHMLSLSTVSKIRTWELLNFSKLILTHVHDFKTTLTDILPIFSTQNDFCFTITPFWEIHITQNWFLVPGLMETDVKKRIFPKYISSPLNWTPDCNYDGDIGQKWDLVITLDWGGPMDLRSTVLNCKAFGELNYEPK